jgi:hypothetical protein
MAHGALPRETSVALGGNPRQPLTPSEWRAPVNPKTICNRCVSLVGLPNVVILDVEDVSGAALRVHVELTRSPQGCPTCGVIAHVKDRRRVELVDLPMGGRPMRLVWVKRRFRCPESSCPSGSWTEDDPRIASKRLGMTDRAGRSCPAEIQRSGRPLRSNCHSCNRRPDTATAACATGASCTCRSTADRRGSPSAGPSGGPERHTLDIPAAPFDTRHGSRAPDGCHRRRAP